MAYQPPHIVFDCEVLTPMFLAGADQNSAELRASSVRGMLRYWYRALLGGRGYTGKELARKEGEVFGTIGYKKEIDPCGGAVEVLTKVAPGVLVKKDSQVPRPGNPGQMIANPDFIGVGSGSGYLWYSVALGKNNRGYFPERTKFQVALVAPRGNTDALYQATYSFWCLTFLGGLGTRNRKGAGSFKAQVNIKNSSILEVEKLPNFEFNGNNSKELAQFIKSNLGFIIKKMGPTVADPALKFDVIAPGRCVIGVAGLSAKKSLEAAKLIGIKLQKFRKGSWGLHGDKKPEREEFDKENIALKSILKNRRPLPKGYTLERPEFGLPYTVTYVNEQKRGRGDFRGGSIEINSPLVKRRASPMILSLAQSNNFSDTVIITFDSQFLPKDNLTLNIKGGSVNCDAVLKRGVLAKFRRESLRNTFIPVEING